MTWKYGRKTDPLNSDLTAHLNADELKEFWERAWTQGLVHTMNPKCAHGVPSESGLIVAVSGGRDYTNTRHVFEILDELHARRPIKLIIEGGCPVGDGGADARARQWAVSRQVNCVTIPPKSNLHGWPAAGPKRNAEMAEWKPDLWVLFPGNRGTASARRQAELYGIETLVV